MIPFKLHGLNQFIQLKKFIQEKLTNKKLTASG